MAKTTESNPVNDALKLPLGDAFEADLAAALEAAGDISPVVIAMIDLDRFMHINDDFGREAGDRFLIDFGRYLMQAEAPGSTLYRYSGDAFAFLFQDGTEKEEVFLMMERVRQGYPLKDPSGIQQTITIGIAASPDDGTRDVELMRKADGALYRGKVSSGGNRVMLAREEKMVTKTSHYTVEQLQRLTKLSKREGIGEAILLREALDALLKKYDV